MPKRVVDFFETVEVRQPQTADRCTGPGGNDGNIKLMFQASSVQQVCQRVAHRLEYQPFLFGLSLGDVDPAFTM